MLAPSGQQDGQRVGLFETEPYKVDLRLVSLSILHYLCSVRFVRSTNPPTTLALPSQSLRLLPRVYADRATNPHWQSILVSVKSLQFVHSIASGLVEGS